VAAAAVQAERHPWAAAAERCVQVQRHPSSWSVRHQVQVVAAAVLHQHLAAAAVGREDDSFPLEEAGANPGRAFVLVQAAKAHWVVVCPRWAATRLEEQALPHRTAVAAAEAVHPLQVVAAGAYPRQAEAAAARRIAEAEAADHREPPTLSEVARKHLEVAAASRRTAAEVADQAERPFAVERPSLAADHRARPFAAEHPSWEADHPEGPSSAVEHRACPFRPSLAGVLVAQAEHPAYRPSSAAFLGAQAARQAYHPSLGAFLTAFLAELAARQACPFHPSSAAALAARQACPFHPSSAAAQKVLRHRMSAASGLVLAAADTPEEAAKAARQACPQSTAASAAQIPAPLLRYAEHRGTACAGCSCAAEHIASSTR